MHAPIRQRPTQTLAVATSSGIRRMANATSRYSSGMTEWGHLLAIKRQGSICCLVKTN